MTLFKVTFRNQVNAPPAAQFSRLRQACEYALRHYESCPIVTESTDQDAMKACLFDHDAVIVSMMASFWAIPARKKKDAS